MERIQFGLALNYDSGRSCTATINETTAIEVHNSEASSDMWYHVGKIKGATIEWAKSTKYSNGYHPSIAINNQNIIVEVHETSNVLTNSMYCKVGVLNGSTIEWGGDDKYDSGVQPNVAINDNGVVVEVHKSQGYNQLYYRVGKINGKSVSWSSSHNYDSGVTPAVTISNSGLVIETHKSEGSDKLYYKVGHINGNSINWGNSMQYQDGLNPSIAVTDDGRVIEVHESQGLTGLWQLSGTVSGNTINWSSAFNYDSGSNPKTAMSLSGKIAIQVHQSSTFGLWYSTSKLMNNADFMGDMLPLISDIPLNKMVLPATHDTGMYTTGLSSLAKTQDLNLYEQLSAGARYFDLRPDKDLDIYHGPMTGPSLKEVLEDIKKFYAEGHKELSILKFSHFDNFTESIYKNMKEMINEYLGNWMFTKLPDGTARLADVSMGTYLNSGGKVLIVVDSNWAVDYPEKGFWVYRDWESDKADQGDLTVFDQYSNTTSYSDMKNDQLQKLSEFNGKCRSFQNTPCDLFLLSWTLTPVTGVWLYAQEADRNLGQVMSYVQPNRYGLFTNLLYLDYFEYARPTFIAQILIKTYNNLSKGILEKEFNNA